MRLSIRPPSSMRRARSGRRLGVVAGRSARLRGPRSAPCCSNSSTGPRPLSMRRCRPGAMAGGHWRYRRQRTSGSGSEGCGMRVLPDEGLVPAAMMINGRAETGRFDPSFPAEAPSADHVGPKLQTITLSDFVALPLPPRQHVLAPILPERGWPCCLRRAASARRRLPSTLAGGGLRAAFLPLVCAEATARPLCRRGDAPGDASGAGTGHGHGIRLPAS